MTWDEMAGNVEQSPFISFVDELDGKEIRKSVKRTEEREESLRTIAWVKSAEELDTISKNNLRGITLQIWVRIWATVYMQLM